MIKTAPSIGRILAMVAFTLSCFGIVVYLWHTFGGPVPLKPVGYRVTASFPEATQLPQEAEVRISGVPVGKVKKTDPNTSTGRTDVVLELDSRYAPIPQDSAAILRQKSLLGETYVELTPGSRDAARIPDGGSLEPGRIGETVELDEVFRSFDPVTRRRFSAWLDQQGRAVSRRGRDLSYALAGLTPFAEETDDVLEVLRRQGGATRRFVGDAGAVLEALTEREGQLRELIVNSNRLWETVARRDTELADAVRVLPTFLREGQATTLRLSRFAEDTHPLVDELRPAARDLSPLLIDTEKLAPDLRDVFGKLDPVLRAGRRGLPASEQVLDDLRPLLGRLDPFLSQLTPIVDYLGLYKREIAGLLANGTAATQATGPAVGIAGERYHYLRGANKSNPEILAAFPTRLSTNRSNPYPAPGAYDKLRDLGHLQVFGEYACTSTPVPSPPQPLEPWMPADLAEDIEAYIYGGADGNTGKAPPCDPQRPLGNVLDQPGLYPLLKPLR